jgi:hypothetical protein
LGDRSGHDLETGALMSLECDNCGSRPAAWNLLSGQELPGSQCPCCYLADFDCDGILVPECLLGLDPSLRNRICGTMLALALGEEWLRVPDGDLDGASPAEVVALGRAEAIADMLEDKLLGQPG